MQIFGEIRFLMWRDVINSNSWLLAIIKEFSEGLPLFKVIFFVLKLKRVLTKIDISWVKSWSEGYTHPPTCINLMQTVGRLDMWVTPKTDRPSFCALLKLSHALDGLFSVLSRLDGRKHKCTFCWMKHQWTWLPSDNVARDSF